MMQGRYGGAITFVRSNKKHAGMTERDLEKEKQSKEKKIDEVERDIRNYRFLAWVIVSAGILVFGHGLWAYFCGNNVGDDDFKELNLLGDYYGGTVASIWALAGVFFIYISFLGQKQQLLQHSLELTYTKEEMRLQREETKLQRKELEAQNLTLRQQRFENTFFQLLNLFNTVAEGMKISGIHATGRGCFVELCGSIENRISENLLKETDKIRLIISAYDELYHAVNKSILSHYFKTFYHLIKFVDQSDIIDKMRYTAIARSQLSHYEQIILCFNGIHNEGKKFKPLIEQYALLHGLHPYDIMRFKTYVEQQTNRGITNSIDEARREFHMAINEVYAPSAFGPVE